MERRHFLQGLALAAGMAPFGAANANASGAAEQAQRLGFHSIDVDRLDSPPLAMTGRVPEGLHGVLYRNGPARHERAGARYRHWFDGDGMVQAFRISRDGIAHHARYVQTEKYVAEQRAGRFRRAAFGTVLPGAEPVTSPDSINVANISMLSHAGELLALWEAGSAHRIDPDSLATLGRKTWRADLAGLPFSAHPKVEPDGTLWNFGTLASQGLLVLYRISARGELQKAEAIPVADLPMIHDFAVTERHLVFLLPPLILDPERLAAGGSFAESHRWRPRMGMRILIIDKADWTRRRMHELDSGMVFHIGNAWEDKQGVIRLSYLRSDDDSVLRAGFDVMRNNPVRPSPTRIALLKIDPAKGATQETLAAEAEFPSIDPRHVGRRYRQIVTIGRSQSLQRHGFDLVQRHDLETGTVDRYQYGAGWMAEEHILVPTPADGTEGRGWVIGTALDLAREATVLSIFDADALASGPIAQACLPYALPLGLHGIFRPRA